MFRVNNKKWVILFYAIALLVLAQVAWWVTLFLNDVKVIEQLRIENTILHIGDNDSRAKDSLAAIRTESRRRRFMFWSESLTFALLTCFGLYLMYQLLRAEERSKKIQRDFVDIFTHESKTPLTALKLRLESARDKTENSPVQRDLSLCLDEVRRLTSLFENAMSLNRMDRNANITESIALAEIVEATARSMEPFFKKNNVDLSLDLDRDIVVSADPYALRNVLQNLFENAVIYNHQADKTLKVTVDQDSGQARLLVTDNGPGIGDADPDRLFDQFFRGKGKSQIPGTGLGLFIARRVVEAHQGKIQWESGEGGGSCFKITLPTTA